MPPARLQTALLGAARASPESLYFGKNFGEVDVQWEGRPTVTWRIFGQDGRPRLEASVPLEELSREGAAASPHLQVGRCCCARVPGSAFEERLPSHALPQAELARWEAQWGAPALNPADVLACAAAPLNEGLSPPCARVVGAMAGRATSAQWVRFYGAHALLLGAGGALAAALVGGPVALAALFGSGACSRGGVGCLRGGRGAAVVAAATAAAYAFTVATLRAVE